jgi:hypothetical protein
MKVLGRAGVRDSAYAPSDCAGRSVNSHSVAASALKLKWAQRSLRGLPMS